MGVVDSKGSFEIEIRKDSRQVCGSLVILRFKITLDAADYQVLHKVKGFFGCGTLQKNLEDGNAVFEINRMEHIKEKLIPFFEKYTLQSKKKILWIKFRRVFLWITQKDSLTEEVLKKILHLKSSGFKIESKPL